MPIAHLFRSLWSFCLIGIGLCCMSCQRPATEPGNSHQFIDDRGKSITVSSDSIRIIPLAPSLTEVLYLIEAGPLLAGVSQVDNYPPEVSRLPRFSSWPLDIESIVSLDPTLVIATTQVNATRDTDVLEELGIPVAYYDFATFEDIPRVARNLVKALQLPPSSLSPVEKLVSDMDALKARTSDLSSRPRVLVLVGDSPLYSFGKESYIHSIVAAAGGESITRHLALKGPILSEEYVLQEQPDFIVGPFGSNYSAGELLELHPSWDLVPAVQHGNVYGIEADFILRPGPRLYNGALALARLLHPDLFGDS